MRSTDGKRLKSENFELKWEWGTELSKVAKNNYFHSVLSETQMVWGQIEVSKHNKNIFGASFCRIQALLFLRALHLSNPAWKTLQTQNVRNVDNLFVKIITEFCRNCSNSK